MPFANLDRRGCFEAKWHYFAPRLGLAWRMFGNNRTVLRLGAGLTYDQEFGILKARTMGESSRSETIYSDTAGNLRSGLLQLTRA